MNKSNIVILCTTVFLIFALKTGNTKAQIFGQGDFKVETFDKKLFKDLKYRNVGPYRGGRSIAVAGVESDPLTYYTGFAGGGVFKTVNGGNTWYPISDGFFNTAAVGAIEVAPSNPNIIYAGMGETDIRGNISAGDGLYKSTDAGRTWKHMGLGETQFIGDIKIHPDNPDIIWVSALGQIFGNTGNEERGVYKSTDGGKTFRKVLFRNNFVGALHVGLDPNNPEIMFATMWKAYRNPWKMSSGGEGSGIFKSTDGGESWTEITTNPGMPKGLIGKARVEVSPANSSVVYAMIEGENGGLYRSDDGGSTWEFRAYDGDILSRPWYYTRAVPDTQNEDIVYVLNVGLYKSTDGGRTFSTINTPHGDHHDLWISRSNPNRMIVGDDGGGQVTYDGGKSWSSYYTSATAQFYHVILDNQFPYLIYGAQQDNSTVAMRSRTAGANIAAEDWWPVAGGESGYIAPDPTNPNITYGGSYGGSMNRFDAEINMTVNTEVWPENEIGSPAKDVKFRFQWTFPIIISPHNPEYLYATSQYVHRSADKGKSWTVISPDLTRNDVSKQDESGGPITKEDISTEYYNTIFAFTESPVEPGVLWAGSDDGLIHLSRDNGRTWNNVTPKDMPETMISIIDPSHHDGGTMYFAATRYKFNDFRPMLYKTHDYGRTWTKITNGIRDMDFTRAIREDPNKKGLLFAGTETGMYVSFNDGAEWQSLRLNMPAVAVTDIAIHKRDRDLVVSTQGRAFYILDDLPVLEQLTDAVAKSDSYFFAPEASYLFGRAAWWGSASDNVSPNPDFGVPFFYYLKNKPEDEIRLELYDPRGTFIRSFSDTVDEFGNPVGSDKHYPNEALTPQNVLPGAEGLNKFVWNFRYPKVTKIAEGTQILEEGSLDGPRAIPGTYSAKFYVGNKLVGEQSFVITKDPRLTDVTREDFEAQFELASIIKAKQDTTNKAINHLREVMKEVRRVTASGQVDQNLQSLADNILAELTDIENELIENRIQYRDDVTQFAIKLNNKLAALATKVEAGYTRPGEQHYEVFEDLSRRVDIQFNRFKKILETDFAAFNEGTGNQFIPIKN